MRVRVGMMASVVLLAGAVLGDGCKRDNSPGSVPFHGYDNKGQIICAGAAPNRICKITLDTLKKYGAPCNILSTGKLGPHDVYKDHDPFSLSVGASERLMVVPQSINPHEVKIRGFVAVQKAGLACPEQPFGVGKSSNGFGEDISGLPVVFSNYGCEYELVVQANEEDSSGDDHAHPKHPDDSADPVDPADPDGPKHHYFCVDPHFEMVQ